jgi:hypothetical protein
LRDDVQSARLQVILESVFDYQLARLDAFFGYIYEVTGTVPALAENQRLVPAAHGQF